VIHLPALGGLRFAVVAEILFRDLFEQVVRISHSVNALVISDLAIGVFAFKESVWLLLACSSFHRFLQADLVIKQLLSTHNGAMRAKRIASQANDLVAAAELQEQCCRQTIHPTFHGTFHEGDKQSHLKKRCHSGCKCEFPNCRFLLLSAFADALQAAGVCCDPALL
jgi:hypothetical protein